MAKNPIKLTLLGTGTSQGVPVIGCDCPVCISENPYDKRLRTAGLFQVGEVNIAIDAGPDFRQQMLRTNIKELHAILLTHEHNDHMIGMDDVRPFNFRSRQEMTLYASPEVEENVRDRFSYAFDENPYPGSPRFRFQNIGKDRPFVVEGVEIVPIEAMHGTLPVLGFRIGNCTYLTDVKTMAEEEKEKAKHSKVLILNALHHRPHHSHLNLKEALELIEELEPEAAYLTHLSHQMGLHEEINRQLPSHVQLGHDGLELSV